MAAMAPLVAALAMLLAPVPARAEAAGPATPPDTLKVLFLGDKGHHQPAARAAQLIPVLAKRGIEITYHEDTRWLNPITLSRYDALIVYANTTFIEPHQEKALLDYVEQGGGFVPLHCASYCFLNSPKYIALVGAQFQKHGTGVFRVNAAKPEGEFLKNNALLKDLPDFESWDETYVHAKHNDKDRVVLQTRKEGEREEPWTWIRTQGKGRIFYTAWGHDQRTWGNEGFVNLVEKGIRWTTQERLIARTWPKVEPFKFVEGVKLPNYPASDKWGVQEAPITKMQLPLSPQEALKHVVTMPGFEVKIAAHEPQIRKSLAMNWDQRGRLWLAESIDYPNELQPEGKGRDTIRICEDTNRDGVMDKFTVFADNLSIPTSLTFAYGGVVVYQAPHTLFLKDTDGDDKADVREVLFTGWSTGDTHAGPSNLVYGHDGWLYGMVGYSGFSGEIAGEKRNFRTGFHRFKLAAPAAGKHVPTVTQFEFLRNNNNNTWGVAFSEEGVLFGSTANRNPSVYLGIPNRYYERVTGWSSTVLAPIANHHYFMPIMDHVRQVDQHHGYTAAAGHALYTARLFPKEWWNCTAFVTEGTGHLVGTFLIRPDGTGGAGFKSQNDWNLIASDDEWCAPIMAEVGPDGAVWVIDWYNYIVQHNPTPAGFKTGKGNAYETELRDKKHCRIYRVLPAASRAVSGPTSSLASLDQNKPDQLLAALTSDNLFWRRHAQRLLIERGNKDVVPALVALTADRRVDEIGLNAGAIHALWTLHGLGALTNESSEALAAAVAAMKHPSAGVRRNAVQVLPASEASLKAILDAGLLRDAAAQVRLMALLAVADQPAGSVASDRAGAEVLALLKDPAVAADAWLRDAATTAAATHDSGFLRALLASQHAKGADVNVEKPAPAPKPSNVNLLANPSFEDANGNDPKGWRSVAYSGKANFSVDSAVAHTGKNSVRVESETGVDGSWSITPALKPATRYRLSVWVKTKGFQKNTGLGVQMNLHELQQRGKSSSITKDTDWTKLTTEFETAGHKALQVNLLVGGWGQSKGTVWFDDAELVEVGPATGAVDAPPVAGGLPGDAGVVVGIVTRHYAARAPVDSVVATLASLRGSDEALAAFVLDGLVKGWPDGKSPKLSEADRGELGALMESLPTGLRDRLVVLSNKWGEKSLFAGNVAQIAKQMEAALADAKAGDAARVDAAQRLVRLRDDQASIDAALKPLALVSTPELSAGLIGAVAGSRLDATGNSVIAVWANLSPAARKTAVSVLLRRTAWTDAMLAAIEGGKLHRSELTAADWQLLKTHADGAIASRAKKLDTASPNADRMKVFEKMQPALALKGDLNAGKEFFTKTCAQCHTMAGVGGKVGPDLTGIGARDPKDILAEIVDPNRSVEGNFRLWMIQTKEGDALNGRLDAETRTSVELLDLQGKRHVIQRSEIDEMRVSPLSIMPVGLIDHLKPEEIASLLEFLKASKGK